MATPPDTDEKVDDLSARAGWLYYQGRLTQDQIAAELGVSRQRAQRLVARAVTDGLIRVRIDHRISDCMDLEADLRDVFGLSIARVAPALPAGSDPLNAIAPVAARELERIFSSKESLVVAFGTGRSLRRAVDDMRTMDGSHHKVVSLIGNVAPDGSASFFEVIMRIADKLQAPHYPMAVPVLAKDEMDRAHYQALPHVQNTRALAQMADYTIVGIGQMGMDAPLLEDGFVSPQQLAELRDGGAVGEMAGWTFDADGTYLTGGVNRIVTAVQVPQNENPVICLGAGESKHAPLMAALRGNLISGLVTDEPTAKFLLRKGT